jgi:hypothetical protein
VYADSSSKDEQLLVITFVKNKINTNVAADYKKNSKLLCRQLTNRRIYTNEVWYRES